MNSIVILLALIGAVFGNPMPEGEAPAGIPPGLHERLQSSCPGRCLMQDKYRDWLVKIMPKAKEFGKNIAEGTTTPFIPNIPAEKFDTYCTEIDVIKTCVAACNDAADAEKKQKATAVLTAAKELVCDADIKTNFNCLADLSKTPSEQCNTQCQEFKAPILEAHQSYQQTGQRDWDKAKQAAKATCQMVNCRLKCRKTDIINKCQQAGYDAAKKTVQKLGNVGKTVHAQFRPAENFPAECNPDQLIQGA